MKKRTLLSIGKIFLVCTLVLSLTFISVGCKKTVTYESYISDDSYIETNNTDNSSTNSEGVSSNASNSNSGKTDTSLTNGKTFTISSQLLPTSITSDSTLFEKVLFKRIEEVEKQYGCKIKIINSIKSDMSVLTPLIQANKDFANVIEVNVNQMVNLMAAGYIVPWNQVSGINASDSKWISGYTKLATYKGNNYGLQFEKPPEVRFTMIMNKSLIGESKANEIYNLIKQKKWDFNTFRQYAIDATKIQNGKTVSYGLGGDPQYCIKALLSANNANIITMKNNKASATFTSQPVIDTLNFFNKLTNEDKVFMTTSGMSNKKTYEGSMPDYTQQFIKGKIAFLIEDSWVLNQKIKAGVKNFKYGMINIPMGPNASNYTSESGHARVYVMPITNKDREFTSTIFNALAESPKGYEGEWYWEDIQADYFQNDDKQSLEIYKNSLNNMSFDLGFAVSPLWTRFATDAFLGSIFWNSGKTSEATLKGLEGTFDSTINSMFNK